MKKISIDEMKSIELSILIDVDKFCRENKIQYSICGGTLLGAVRHGGFIPWDDDVDIMMPRKDYIRFIEEYRNENYVVRSIENDEDYWGCFARVFDKRTMIKHDTMYFEKKGDGICIDVFPVDNLPDGIIRRKILFLEQEIMVNLYKASVASYTKTNRYRDIDGKFTYTRSALRNVCKYIAVTLFRPLPSKKIIKIINKNASRWKNQSTKFVASIVDCHYGADCEVMPSEKFYKIKNIKFEGVELMASEAYDIYLKRMYGDYMKLPPIDKRVRHHDSKAYWKNE